MGVVAERITLGKTDLRVSPLGIGTWAWGDRFVWGYGRGYGDGDLAAAFEAALSVGVNFFDTAEVYGPHRSERLLGRFIRKANAPDAVVATKFWPMPWRLRRGDLLRALRGSLRRLQLPQVELYQVHLPFGPVSVEARMEAMADAVEAGLTRAAGVSNYSASQMRRAHAVLSRRGVPLTSNQVAYSLLDRAPERNGVLSACRELGATLIAYSPLGMGLLSGRYTPQSPPPGLRGRRYGRAYLARIQPLVRLLVEIGRAYGGMTSSQVALNWTICKGTLPIPGVKNARQVLDNAGALGWRLGADDVAALDAASDKVS